MVNGIFQLLGGHGPKSENQMKFQNNKAKKQCKQANDK
jgi:hypothetical protein